MKQKISSTVQFFVIGFLTAFIINAIVSTAQILYTKDFTFAQTAQIFVFTLIRGALFFGVTYLVLYLVAVLFHQFNRGRIFWVLMITGITLIMIAYMLFKKDFLRYTNETRTIGLIAAFSIMVSLSSQYQQFVHPEGLSESLLTQE